MEQDLEETTDKVTASLERINKYFLSLSTPKIHHPYDKNNFIKVNDATFENTCYIMERKGIVNPSEMTLFSFISRIKQLEAESKKK